MRNLCKTCNIIRFFDKDNYCRVCGVQSSQKHSIVVVSDFGRSNSIIRNLIKKKEKLTPIAIVPWVEDSDRRELLDQMIINEKSHIDAYNTLLKGNWDNSKMIVVDDLEEDIKKSTNEIERYSKWFEEDFLSKVKKR